MFDKSTERTIRVVNIAQAEARKLRHNYIGTEQLLLGLIAMQPSIAAQVLADLDISLEEAQEQVQAVIGRKDRLVEADYHPEQGARPLRRAITRLLEDSLAEEILSGRVKAGDCVSVDLDNQGQIEIA